MALEFVQVCVGRVACNYCASEVVPQILLLLHMVNHFWPADLLFQVGFAVEAFRLYVGYAFGETGVHEDQVARKVLVVYHFDEGAYLDIPCFAVDEQVFGALAAAGFPHVLLLV